MDLMSLPIAEVTDEGVTDAGKAIALGVGAGLGSIGAGIGVGFIFATLTSIYFGEASAGGH